MIDYSRLRDFSYYTLNFLKIKAERTRQIIPLALNIEQQKLHRLWEWQLKTIGMVRIIILKDRRIGASTYVDARAFHQTVTIPNTAAFVITHDKESLSKIFDMSKLFYDYLPPEIRPMIRYNNTTKLVFENPNSRDRIKNPGLRSLMEVFSANTGTASRSGGYSIGHFSEVAFYNDAETLITSTVPAIPDAPGTVKVYESTGNGKQGFFYEQWKKAKKSLSLQRKLSNYHPIFFSWLTFPEYKKPFFFEQQKRDFEATLDEEENYIIQKFGASLEQLHWRRTQILEFDGVVEKFHQEFPCDDEEAFISKGNPYFAKSKLLGLRVRCVDPKEKGELTKHGFDPNEDGRLSIWERPKPGYEYVLGVDVAEGIEGGDYSTIEILKVPKGSPVVEQVAEWKGWIDAVSFASVIDELARWYNDGLVSPETGPSIGYTTLNELKQIYWNIYRWQYFDRFKHYETEKLGWQTNQATKPLLTSYTSACITLDTLIIHSQPLIDEMLSFVRNTTNSGEADYNCSDDLIMAYMIALYTLAHTHQSGSLLLQLGHGREEVPIEVQEGSKIADVLEKMKKSVRMDVELANGELFYPDGMVESGDRSWLNY